MKKITSFVVICLLFVVGSIQTYAHSHLRDSSPQANEIVTTEMKTVSIQFDGKIMEGSYIELKNEEGAIIEPISNVIGDGVLTASYNEAFTTGVYDVHWNIISADGHPLEGDYSFAVQYEVTEQSVSSTTSNEATSNEEAEAASSNSSPIIYIVLAVAVIVVFASILLLRKRKK
jgi:copper resistance protein C